MFHYGGTGLSVDDLGVFTAFTYATCHSRHGVGSSVSSRGMDNKAGGRSPIFSCLNNALDSYCHAALGAEGPVFYRERRMGLDGEALSPAGQKFRTNALMPSGWSRLDSWDVPR